MTMSGAVDAKQPEKQVKKAPARLSSAELIKVMQKKAN